jgi:hypothetical protein
VGYLQVDLAIYGGSGRFFVQGSDEEIATVTAKKSVVKVSLICYHELHEALS